VLAALIAVPVPFLIALPVMRSTRAFYGTHFWVAAVFNAGVCITSGLGAVFTAGIMTLLAVKLGEC
jgi:hypothetical protein